MSETDTSTEGEKPAAESKTDADKPAPESATQPKTFDEDYVKTLRSEAAQRRSENQKLKERLDELEERDKSELEKLTGKVSKAEQAKADAEARLLRFEVAAEKQVPADALDLLNGNTREELEAKADRILQLVKSRNDTDTKPDFDGGPRETAPEALTPEQEHNRAILKLAGLEPTQT